MKGLCQRYAAWEKKRYLSLDFSGSFAERKLKPVADEFKDISHTDIVLSSSLFSLLPDIA